MTDCEKKENEIGCLFEDKSHDVIGSEENFFHDKTDLYIKENEEVFIATSPSFSMNNTKQSIDDIYSTESAQIKNESCNDDTCDDHLKCDTTFSDISSDSHSVDYTDPSSYPAIHSEEGQSYFINSDYTQLSNVGIELSKGYFYVLSPIGNTSTLVRAAPDDSLAQVVNTHTLLTSSAKDLDNTLKECSSDESKNVDTTLANSFRESGGSMDEPPSTTISSTSTVTSEFEGLSDYVNLIPGIPDSPAKDHHNMVTWHRVIPNQEGLTVSCYLFVFYSSLRVYLFWFKNVSKIMVLTYVEFKNTKNWV